MSCLLPVAKNGDVCISILHEPGEDKYGYEKPEERWLPIHTVETIMLSVISMLADPNGDSPANVDAAVSTCCHAGVSLPPSDVCWTQAIRENIPNLCVSAVCIHVEKGGVSKCIKREHSLVLLFSSLRVFSCVLPCRKSGGRILKEFLRKKCHAVCGRVKRWLTTKFTPVVNKVGTVSLHFNSAQGDVVAGCCSCR